MSNWICIRFYFDRVGGLSQAWLSPTNVGSVVCFCTYRGPTCCLFFLLLPVNTWSAAYFNSNWPKPAKTGIPRHDPSPLQMGRWDFKFIMSDEWLVQGYVGTTPLGRRNVVTYLTVCSFLDICCCSCLACLIYRALLWKWSCLNISQYRDSFSL